MDFDLLSEIGSFYDPNAEKNEKVRRMWYIYCFHYLSKINKDWKKELDPSRLRKKTFIYKHITSSDEAMTQWFLKIWQPKIEDERNKGWPPVEKSQGKGEQELKAGLTDYVAIHHKIVEGKKQESGALALRWNDIFWEEMVINHPTAFNEAPSVMFTDMPSISEATSKDLVVLPDPDDDDDLLELFKQRESLTSISASTDANLNFDVTVSTEMNSFDTLNIQKEASQGNDDDNSINTISHNKIQSHPI
jgi:hypothetical protein